MNKDLELKDAELKTKIASLEKDVGSLSTTAQVESQPYGWWSTTNAVTMSSIVLVFGVFICTLVVVLLRQRRNADSVLKVMGTILIIISSIFLVVAGYSDTQIAPVMGLLGTIAGYLLGKNADAVPARQSQEQVPRQEA